MYFLYILRSIKTGDLYFDVAEDINQAVEDHQIGLIDTTKDKGPLQLVYYETFPTEEEAKTRYEELINSEEAQRELIEKLKKGIKAGEVEIES